MAEVPRTVDRLAMHQVARIGARAFGAVTGRLVPHGMLAIQCAIVGLENANGDAIVCHNWGNLQGNGPAGYWTPPHDLGEGQPTHFQAFVDDDQGARAWWSLMLFWDRRRYVPVLRAGLNNDPREAVHQLYKLGYVLARTANEESAYAGTVVKLFARARAEWIPKARVYPTAPAYVAGASALGALAAKLGGF